MFLDLLAHCCDIIHAFLDICQLLVLTPTDERRSKEQGQQKCLETNLGCYVNYMYRKLESVIHRQNMLGDRFHPDVAPMYFPHHLLLLLHLGPEVRVI